MPQETVDEISGWIDELISSPVFLAVSIENQHSSPELSQQASEQRGGTSVEDRKVVRTRNEC